MWIIVIDFPHNLPRQYVCNADLDYSENRAEAVEYDSYGQACADMSHCYSSYGAISVEAA